MHGRRKVSHRCLFRPATTGRPVGAPAAVCLVALVLLLGGCAARLPAPIEERDLAGEVRRQTAESSSDVEVYALSDPAGLHLLERARVAEQAGQLDEAARLVREALALTPDDPEYWQYLAELELQGGDFLAAIEHAKQSFQLGPRIGPLCYRNWLTRQRAHEALRQAQEAGLAGQQAEGCLSAPTETI